MRKLATPAMVIYVILALVVGSYLYYSQYYIPHKEDILINKSVRTLASIEEGISNKEGFLESFMEQRLKANTLLSLIEIKEKENALKKLAMGAADDSSAFKLERTIARLGAQKVIVSNHVKPLTISPAFWEKPDPRIVFNSGEFSDEAYLEIKHLRSKVNDSLTKALNLQKDLTERIKNDEEILDRLREEKELAALLEEAQKAFFVMGSEVKGYESFYPTRKAKAVRPKKSTPSEKVEEVMVEERLVATVTLDTLLRDVMENEIFQCLVLHSVKDAKVFYSSNPRVINPIQKFDSDGGDSVATKFGVNIFETKVNSKPYVEFRRYVNLGDRTFYLSGFIDKEEYNEYLREIDYFLLILVLLSTFTLIGAVPLIKVFVINEWERLRDGDVLFSALSMLFVVFLGSLIFSTVHYYSEVEGDLKQDLSSYGNRLKSNFVNEVDSLVTFTEDFDFQQSNYWANGHQILFHEFFQTDEGVIDNIILPYDEFGINWDTTEYVGKFFRRFVDLSGRDYIQKIIKDDAYTMVHPNQDSIPMFLESVFSYSRAQKEAVISFPKGDKINGISVDLKSLMWSIPPEGFGYALIDRDMNVLFSSKKAKNNFKNLRTDLVGMEFIAQSIAYSQPMTGQFDFGRDKFLGSVLPIDNILTKRGDNPAFYILTFANHDLVEWHTGLTSLLSAMACFGILLASFLLLVLQGLFYINRKESRYFRQSNFYDTVFPERQDGLTYVFLISISLLGIVIGILLYRFGLSALIRYGVVQVLLFGLLRPLLLSYNVDKKGRFRRRAYFVTVFIILIGAILFLPGGADSTLLSSDKTILIVYVSLALILALIVHRLMLRSKNKPLALRRSLLFNKLKFILQSRTVKNLYIFSMYAWILAILVFPFVLISDKCEVIVENSFKTLSGTLINTQLEAENAELLSLYSSYNNIDSKVNQLHLDDDWADFLKKQLYFGSDLNQKVDAYRYADFFQPVFALFASRYSYDPLYVPAQGEGFFKRRRNLSKYQAPDRGPESANTTKIEKADSPAEGNEENYSYADFSNWSFIRNLSFFLFSLLLVYGLVRLFLNRIVFNISEELQGGRVRSYSVIDGLEKYQAHKIETGLPLRLFLVGIPRSRRTTILKSLALEREDLGFIDFGRNTSFLDQDYNLANIPLELLQAKAIVIRFWFPEIVGTEYLDRLRKLTRYMEETDLYQKGSVILSDLTITQIEEKWYEMNSDDEINPTANEVMLYLKEWFRSYREFLLPLEKERFGDSHAVNGQIGFNDAYDDYLNKSYYSPIYFSVWHSLSVKERFIVYDLAEDGLMNARDSFMLMKLKRKGILSYNRNTYRMELFHRSFKLFVKHGVSIKEIMNIERFSKKNGSWGQIRLALLLLILAMLLFIYELMPNMFNALAGAIGVIASFSGAVSQLTGKVSLPQFGKLFGGNKGSSEAS